MVKQEEYVTRLGMPMVASVWRNTKIDIGAAGLVSLFNVVFNQFFIVFALQQGASHLQVGLLTAANPIGLLLSPMWSSLIEKANNPKPFVVIPNLIGRSLLIFPALFPYPSVYLAMAFIIQLLVGIQAPAYAQLISRIYPASLRGRLMGYVRAPMGLLMIGLAYLVGKWSNAYGPSGALIAAAIAGVASILLFNRLRVPKVEDLPSKKAPALRFSLRDQWQLVKHNKVLAVFLVATMFSGFGNMLANPLYQIVQVDVLRMSNMEIGYARAAYFTGLLLTYLIGGRMIDRFDIKYTLLVGIAAYAVVPGLYGFWGSHSSVVIGNFVQGMGEAIWDIGILAFIFRLAPGREASLFGLHLLLFGIRGTIGPLLSSSLSGTVPISAILIAAALCSSVGTVMFWLGNRKREALADGVV